MPEQSKSAKRRFNDGQFHSRYFVGRGIDIGGAPDPLAQYSDSFRQIVDVRTWDLQDGDAQYMAGVPDESVDFIHSSHCLEHLVDVRVALDNWTRILKPGGFMIITVPDENLYEHGQWPSRYNPDHKWSFTICKRRSPLPKSINVVDLVSEFADRLELERLQLVNDFFRIWMGDFDQCLTPVAECAIEIVWKKRAARQS